MSIKRSFGVLSLILLSAPVMPAAAQNQQGIPCSGDFVASLSPGLGSDPVSGAWHSGGETGTIDCQGRKGTLGGDGRYGTKDPDSCTSGGEGWGVSSFILQGETIKNTMTYDFGGISNGLVSGRFEGERLSGTFTFTPTEGDCIKNPATKGKIHIEGTLKS